MSTASSPSRPLRILYMIDEMEALTAGGTERQILQMIALMKDAGAEVQLCLLRNTEWLTEEIAGVPVHVCHLGSILSGRGLRDLNRLRRWIRLQQFDVVQTFFIDSSLIGPVVAKLAGVRVVLGSRRNLNYWMTFSTRFAQRISNLFITRLVANCEAVKTAVAKTEGFDPGRIDVIYNGLDVARFHPDEDMRRRKRRELGFTEEHFVIGNVSVLRPIKGCETFIEMAKLVSQDHPAARFVLVGDGPLRCALENQIELLGMGPVFFFAGSQEDVRPFLNAFDAAVLCSESEGFSNSILEYMAAGLPTVVTDVGGNAEAVGNAGKAVPVGDVSALAREMGLLMKNTDHAKLLSRNALMRVQGFSFPSTRTRLLQYYRSLRTG